MAIEAERFVSDASEQLLSLEERSVASHRRRFSEKKKSSRGVFDESARAAAMISVCSHRSLPNQRLEPTRLAGAVIATRLLRSTTRRISKFRLRARQRVAHH